MAAHGTPRTLSGLAEMPCVTFGDLTAGPGWLFATADRTGVRAVQVRSRPHVNTAEALPEAAAGIGLTPVPSCRAAPASRRARALVLRSFALDPAPVSLLHVGRDVGRGRVPVTVRALLDVAAPRRPRGDGWTVVGGYFAATPVDCFTVRKGELQQRPVLIRAASLHDGLAGGAARPSRRSRRSTRRRSIPTHSVPPA